MPIASSPLFLFDYSLILFRLFFRCKDKQTFPSHSFFVYLCSQIQFKQVKRQKIKYGKNRNPHRIGNTTNRKITFTICNSRHYRYDGIFPIQYGRQHLHRSRCRSFGYFRTGYYLPTDESGGCIRFTGRCGCLHISFRKIRTERLCHRPKYFWAM